MEKIRCILSKIVKPILFLIPRNARIVIGFSIIIFLINGLWWSVTIFLYQLFRAGLLPQIIGAYQGVFFLIILPMIVIPSSFRYFRSDMLLYKDHLRCSFTFTTVFAAFLLLINKYLPEDIAKILKDDTSWGMALTILFLQGLHEYYLIQEQRKTAPVHNQHMTIEETAEYLKIPVNSIYSVIKMKDFPAVKVGRQWCIRIDLLDGWWKKQWSEKEDKFDSRSLTR